MKDFIYVGSWFDKKYRSNSSGRYPTMKAALNLYAQRKGQVIVETGCVRMRDDWGAGYSTVMFSDFCKTHGGHLYTVDISRRNLDMCDQLTKEFESVRTLTESDSVKYLAEFDKKIDLLYLDSYDYPYGQLLEIYGGRVDIHKAEAILRGMSLSEVVEKHKHIIDPCQQHCLKELLAALPHLHDDTVILIDDNELAGGGKSRLAREWLIDNGYECILDLQQTLWIKKK